MKNLMALLLAFASFIFLNSAMADTFIHLRSDTGDYVGGGITRTLTPADGTITATRNFDNGVSINYQATNGSFTSWHLDFGGAQQIALTADNYEDATRFAFHSPTKPGLDVGGDGRGCNKLTGRFIVREAVYGLGGEVLSFAADLEQHCEGGTPALWGTVRYNSNIPLVVPTPNAAAGADRNVLERTAVTLDGGKSSDADGSIVSYQWRQVGGTPSILSTPTAPQTNFTAPGVNQGGEDLSFELEVRDSAGLVDSDTVKIHVASEYDPQFWIYYSSQPGDYIGQGRIWNMGVDDGRFTSSKNFDNGVTIQFQGDTGWTLDFAAPSDALLTPGAYEGAVRWPFHSASQPGLNVSGDGRGCNMLTGRFVVHEVVYGANNNSVNSFAADFEQHCEGAAAGLFGTVRYNYKKPKPLSADLAILLTDSPDPVKAKQKLTYKAAISNQGPDPATGVVVTINLPGTVKFHSATSGCSHASGVVTCALGTVAAGARPFVYAKVIPAKRGSITATASVTGSELDPIPGNNSGNTTTTVK